MRDIWWDLHRVVLRLDDHVSVDGFALGRFDVQVKHAI